MVALAVDRHRRLVPLLPELPERSPPGPAHLAKQLPPLGFQYLDLGRHLRERRVSASAHRLSELRGERVLLPLIFEASDLLIDLLEIEAGVKPFEDDPI